jgi:hypothetical protein
MFVHLSNSSNKYRGITGMDKHNDRGITQMTNIDIKELPRWTNMTIEELPRWTKIKIVSNSSIFMFVHLGN